MTTSLYLLAESILVLAWPGNPDYTYTAEASADAVNWESLPWVLTGTGAEMSYAHEMAAFPGFLRLRFSNDGDTNENSLPDAWELKHFGCLGADPAADPDEDGLSNLAEYLGATDPLDFYNGERPLIETVCGTEWVVRENEMSGQAVSLSVRHASGESWPNAPVRIFLDSGRPAMVQQGDAAAACLEFIAYTDANGRITSHEHGIHVLGASASPVSESLEMEAGTAAKSIRIQTVPGGFTGPPRALDVRPAGEALMVADWQGSPGDSARFILERQSGTNDWRVVLDLPAEELPEGGEDNPAFTTTFSIIQ